MGRPNKRTLYVRNRRLLETEEQRKIRLAKISMRAAERRRNQTPEEREQIREYERARYIRHKRSQSNTKAPKPKQEKTYCRLCLKPAHINSLTSLSVVDSNGPWGSKRSKKKRLEKVEEINNMIRFCLPFFDSQTIDPFICTICLARLKIFYEFSNNCLKNQELIEKYANMYGTTKKGINLNEMIETKFSVSEDEDMSSSETEVSDTSKMAKCSNGDESCALTKPLKMEPDDNCAVKGLTHDVPQSYFVDPKKIHEGTTVKMEPDYIDHPDLIKSESVVNDLSVDHKVFNKTTGIGTDVVTQQSHLHGMENVSLDTRSVRLSASEPPFSKVGSGVDDIR